MKTITTLKEFADHVRDTEYGCKFFLANQIEDFAKWEAEADARAQRAKALHERENRVTAFERHLRNMVQTVRVF